MTVTADHARARRARALAAMFGVAIVVLAADAVSKTLVLERLPGHPPVRLPGGLITLSLARNAGAAFGVGPSYTVIIALLACVVTAFIIRTAARLRSLAWSVALGLLLGGAAGNLADRLLRSPGPMRGRVVDWINLPHFPWTFNLADSAIVGAAALMALLALRDIRIDGAPARGSARPLPGQTP
jgi:signal peptidase II